MELYELKLGKQDQLLHDSCDVCAKAKKVKNQSYKATPMRVHGFLDVTVSFNMYLLVDYLANTSMRKKKKVHWVCKDWSIKCVRMFLPKAG